MSTLAEWILVSGAIVAGVDLRVVVVLGFAVVAPTWFLAFVALHSFRNRSRPTTHSAIFCHGVAGELRSGATLRGAVADAARVVGATELVSRVAEGDKWAAAAPALRRAFPDVASELMVVIESVATSGADSSGLFDELGDIALAHVEAAEEIRIATSSARASAVVLIGMPLAYLGYQLQSGNLARLLATPGSGPVALVGLLLLITGIALSYAIVRWRR